MNIPKICFALACAAMCFVIVAQDKDATFVAGTFNVRVPVDPSPNSWVERLPRCREIIEKNKIDILGLQEPVASQLDSLVENSEYDCIGGGREDFKRKGEFSCILYRRSRFECLSNGTFGLSERPDVPGIRSWGSACPRIATWGIFRDRRSGKEFVYYNTHLDHVSERARCEGIKLLIAHAKKNAAGKPILLSGDFNSNLGSETYRTALTLLNDSAAVSATPHVGPKKTYHGWGRSKGDRPIDFIFVSKEFSVLSHRTDGTLVNGQYASDHYPVIVTLSIK